MRGLFGTGLGRIGIFTCAVTAILAIGALALAGRGMLAGADAQPAERAIQPSGAEAPTPEPVAETAAATAEKRDAATFPHSASPVSSSAKSALPRPKTGTAKTADATG